MAMPGGPGRGIVLIVAGALLLTVPIVPAVLVLGSESGSVETASAPDKREQAGRVGEYGDARSEGVDGTVVPGDATEDATDDATDGADDPGADQADRSDRGQEGDGDQDARRPQPPPDPKPEPRQPTMPATSYLQSGGIAGHALRITIDERGNWARQENPGGVSTGTLTSAQISTLNGLLRSSALADEAKRAAESSGNLGRQCPDGVSRGLQSVVRLYSGTCGFQTPVPTFTEVVTLMTKYTR